MKKLILMCFISTAFISCKKEYTCTRVGLMPDGTGFTTSKTLKEKSRADAQAKCISTSAYQTATLTP